VKNLKPELQPILVAEDDEDHFLLIREAWEATEPLVKLFQVRTGAELLDFLVHSGAYQDAALFPRPRLILLDLNMPKRDGRWALREIKAREELKSIPLVVLSTAQREEDMQYCYQAGANAYLSKPMGFRDWVETMKNLRKTFLEN
jgi:CheY-like chemotaxis protein